ncbi:hypothetical protein [Cohnella sp. 56]|uniref:hypothetical protein n=1 Tax=Cohnella sp. 56 TaxID=3113722 RepID=UPI0030E7DF7D
MYRQLRAIGAALLGMTVIGSAALPLGAAQAASLGSGGAKTAAGAATATFQDRDAQAGEIGGILYFDEDEASSAKGYEAYLADAKGKRYGKALGVYVADRHSFVIPENTKITSRAAALGVYAVADNGKAADTPLATAPLRDDPAYKIGDLKFVDANPDIGAWAAVSWSDPADGSSYDGYLVKYPGGQTKIARKSPGKYTLPLRDIGILGAVSVTPYRGTALEYSAGGTVQAYDDIGQESVDLLTPGDVNSPSAPVSDIHFKPVVSSGKTRVSGELSWYDAASASAVSYVVYSADAAGQPIQPLVDVTNDYPFDGREVRVTLPEFKLKGSAQVAVYAVRDGGRGSSAPVAVPVGGDPDPLFADTDAAAGRIGGTVYVMPRFPAYGAKLQFVDAWLWPVGEPIDIVQGESRYFEIPAGTEIPEGAWKLAIYDNGGLEGSEFEKAPQYIGFEDKK